MIRLLLVAVGGALGYSLAKQKLSRINMIFVALSGFVAYKLTQQAMLEAGEITQNEIAGLDGQGVLESITCPAPGNKRRSSGAGRGGAYGRGRGPMGVPVGRKPRARVRTVDAEVVR
jgi:hypothetical protein